jgi:hypothetical protein
MMQGLFPSVYLRPLHGRTRCPHFLSLIHSQRVRILYLHQIRNLDHGVSSRKQYRSASAFAPIANPSKCPWGEKAFKGYLAGGLAEGADKYDATQLIKKLGGKEALHILVDYVGAHVSSVSNRTDSRLAGYRRQLLEAGSAPA